MRATRTVPAWLLMSALICAEITSTFEISMAFAALPTLTRHFADPVGASWIITSFFLVSAASAALFARLGDIYGRRRVLLIILGIAATGSLISAASTSLGGVIFGRSLQGATGALLPLCLGLMRENLTPKSLSFNIGVMGGALGVSSGAGFLVAGVILDSMGWRAMFYASALLALLGMLAVWLIVPPSPQAKVNGKLDILGGALFASAVITLLLGISKAGKDLTAADSLALLGISVILLIAWCRHELKHNNPLIDVRLFTTRPILLANLVYACVAVGAMIGAQPIITLAQQPQWTGIGLELGATAAGLLKQPTTVMGFIAGPLGGFIAARYGARTAILAGIFLLLPAWSLPLLSVPSFSILLASVVIYSFGIVVFAGAISNQVVAAAPVERTSEAMGLAQVTRSTFMAIGSQIVAALLVSDLVTNDDGTQFSSALAYSRTFLFILLSSLVAFCIGLMLPRRKSPEHEAFKKAVQDQVPVRQDEMG